MLTFNNCFGTSLASSGRLDMSLSIFEVEDPFLQHLGTVGVAVLGCKPVFFVVLCDEEFVVAPVLLPPLPSLVMFLPRAGKDLEHPDVAIIEFSLLFALINVVRTFSCIIGVFSSSGDSNNIWIEVRWTRWFGSKFPVSCSLLLLCKLFDN